MAQIPRTNKRTQSSSLRRIIVGVGVGVVIIIAALINMQLQLHKELEDAQKDMQLYLQQRYNQEFVVERPERSGGGFAVEGRLESIAYPRNDPSLKFTVIRSRTYRADGYVGVVWEREERQRLEPELRAIFGADIKIQLTIRTFGTARGTLPINGAIPSFGNGARQYKQAILYTLQITTSSQLKGHESDMAAKVFALLPLLHRDTDLIFSYTGQAEGKSYGIALDHDAIKNIQTASDLNNYIKEGGDI